MAKVNFGFPLKQRESHENLKKVVTLFKEVKSSKLDSLRNYSPSKAIFYTEAFGIQDFSASDSWLTSF